MTTFYVDISHHDWDRAKGEIDFAAIAGATSSVLCVRATYGDPSGFHPETRHFADMQSGAAAAGFILRGGYHNLVHGDAASMRRQVSWFRSELDKARCAWAMVDIERYGELVNNGLWPRWDDVLRFRDAWYAVEPDRPLVYYLPKWLWRDYFNSPDLRLLHGPLVASNYGANDAMSPSRLYASRFGDQGAGWDSYGNVTPAIWQFGSQCSVPGLVGADINAFRGTLAELAAVLTGDTMLTPDDISKLVQAFWNASWGSGDNRESAAVRLAKASAAASILPTLLPKLDAILTAAEDDSNTTVTLPSDVAADLRADLASIKDAIANVPAATIAEIAS